MWAVENNIVHARETTHVKMMGGKILFPLPILVLLG